MFKVSEKTRAIVRSAAQRAAVVGVVLGSASSAFAVGETTFDSSSYATQITACVAGVLVIGGAVFGLMVAIKSTKWARRAL